MIRLLAAALVLALSGLPLIVVPALPLLWLALPGMALGLAGVVASMVPLVTASAALALIQYTLALTISGATVDLVTATAFGAAIFLLLELVHFAGHTAGAMVSPAVLVAQFRHWLGLTLVATAAAVVLTIVGGWIRIVLPAAALPLVVILSALGALATLAGVVVIATRD